MIEYIITPAFEIGAKFAEQTGSEIAKKFAIKVTTALAAEGVALGIINLMNTQRVPINSIPEEDRAKVASERMLRNKLVEVTCQFGANAAVSAITDAVANNNADDSAALI